MFKFCLLLSVALMFQAGRACDGNNEAEQLAAARQESDEYFASAYGFDSAPWGSSYYQPSARVQGYAMPYEGRTPQNRIQPNYNPFKKYFASSTVNEENDQPEGRFALGGLGANIINTGLFNNRFTPANTWRPFSSLANRIPVTVNPNFNSPLANFDACTSPSGDDGICAPGSVCSLFGGRPSGSCILGKVCCINAITTCGGTVTLNNTYWQSPSTPVSVPSTCALTVRMDTKLVEQLAKPICQIRLDFVSFTTAQPTAGTCTDTFLVGGSTSTVPTICGDNSGQHMYVDVPSSAVTPTDVQLMFNFAAGTATRSWNIKIAMLPCGASYLAPPGCLQYFPAATGRVRSFNWQDIAAAAAPRQLNNQDYNICFRTELVTGQRSTQMCLSVCTTVTGDAFSITTAATVDIGLANANAITGASINSNVGTTVINAAGDTLIATCLYDFLLIAGARDANGIEADRYCGNALNPAAGPPLVAGTPAALGAANSVQVCTPVRPFKITYRTDGTELAVPAALPALPAFAGLDVANTGFCLDFQQR
uniref:CUB domain-containing protein n=2 Tax=Daphnia magna TaxID=35525 RepID=A0A0N8BNF5_9CRUS